MATKEADSSADKALPEANRTFPAYIAIPSSVQGHFGEYIRGMSHGVDKAKDDLVQYATYSYYCGIWYTSLLKDYLTTILDAYDDVNELPSVLFIMPINIPTSQHCIHCTVLLKRGHRGLVQAVDYRAHSLGPKSAKFVRIHLMHLAKCFGMYLQESHV